MIFSQNPASAQPTLGSCRSFVSLVRCSCRSASFVLLVRVARSCCSFVALVRVTPHHLCRSFVVRVAPHRSCCSFVSLVRVARSCSFVASHGSQRLVHANSGTSNCLVQSTRQFISPQANPIYRVGLRIIYDEGKNLNKSKTSTRVSEEGS
jgi:hypothetical protein